MDIPGEEYKISTQRITTNLTALGQLGAMGPIDALDLLGGFEFYSDFARADKIGSVGGEATYYGGDDTVDYQNYAGFLQMDLDAQWFDLSVGGRYHHHSEVGGKFVPRVAITKAWEKFHAKGLFSKAYRTPQIELIQSGVDGIDPETAMTGEVEVGYRFTDNLSAVVNAYWIKVEDILVYSSVHVDYQNFDSVENYGIEAEARYADTWGNVAIGYSYYRNHHNDVPSFCTEGPTFYLPGYVENPANVYESCGEKDGLLLGIPAHKLTLNATYLFLDHFSVNLNGAYISKRISYAPAVGMSQRRTLQGSVRQRVRLRATLRQRRPRATRKGS
jgi:hypothetical protein